MPTLLLGGLLLSLSLNHALCWDAACLPNRRSGPEKCTSVWRAEKPQRELIPRKEEAALWVCLSSKALESKEEQRITKPYLWPETHPTQPLSFPLSFYWYRSALKSLPCFSCFLPQKILCASSSAGVCLLLRLQLTGALSQHLAMS